MEETEKILLNGKRSKNSVNTNTTLNIDLKSNSRILPEDMMNESVNAYATYLSERERSNRFRLIFNIRPYCTNVLFNPFTEVVKYEGSDSAFCINFSESTTSQLETNGIVDKCSIIVKRAKSNSENCQQGIGDFKWTAYEAVRDTQLSNAACGFVYHNGLDIFNNHIMRNKTFKSVMLSENSFSAISGTYETYADGTELYGENYDNVRVYDETFSSGFSKVYLDKNFNTIDDYMRDKQGIIVSESFPKVLENGDTLSYNSIVMPLHLYQKYDIMPFEECYTEKLLENNGWFGFNNDSSINGMLTNPSSDSGDTIPDTPLYNFFAQPTAITACNDSDSTIELSANIEERSKLRTVENTMDINRVINSQSYCAFIDMYPTRNHFTFDPLWNGYRKRLEKNWNYCLTYPSSSTTTDGDGKIFEFFTEISGNNETTIALKAFLYDEYQVLDDGTNALTIYSVCQHGLQVGDTVNIYKNNDVIYDSAKVLKVVDKYIFQVAKEDFNISDKWATTTTQKWSMYRPLFADFYPIIPTNGDTIRYTTDTDTKVSFKRVVDGVECDYYVRIFSRLPNFKFVDREVNDYTLYGNHSDLIERYSDPSSGICDFENHISSLGFANTVYSDEDVELVYTDNVDISYLKDNLGRPISDVFLTIVKNNKGYKEWYGSHNIKSEDVEYSHCFGKINCGFQLCDFYRYIMAFSATSRDVRDINSYENAGLKIGGDTDEIDFYSNRHYYGDIVCYSPLDCDEQVIQNCMHRFNTVQRELNGLTEFDSAPFSGGNMPYDDVINDENSIPARDAEEFVIGNIPHSIMQRYTGMTSQNEGYYYQPHYAVHLKTISQSVSSNGGVKYDVFSCESTNSYLIVTTVNENEINNGDVLTMYDKKTNKIYFLIVDNASVMSFKTFRCFVRDEEDNSVDELDQFFDENGLFRITDITIMGRTDDIPSYAKVVKDGSCRYYWREILPNGIEDDEKIYTFTNGAFYITSQIDFYLRRQDPDGTMISVDFTEGKKPTQVSNYPPNGVKMSDYPSLDAEEYYEEGEIEGC